MKQIVYALLSISLLVGLTGIAGCTGLPTVSPSGEGGTPGAREPEGKLLQLYPGELANQLRNEGLTELQRENIWNKYKGKHVKWVGQVVDVKIWKDSLVATFLNWRSVSVLICGEKEAENLSRLSKNDLVIYRGTLDGYGKDADLFPPDGVLESPLPDERVFPDKQVFRLRDGTIDGLLLTPLWTNRDIEVKNLDEAVFRSNVLYVTVGVKLGSSQYGRIMYALDIQNGKTLWQSGPREGVYRVLGIDKDYIYLLFSHSHRVSWGVSISAPGVITLDKATGETSLTKKLFVEYNYSPYILWADNSIAYVYGSRNEGNDEISALGIESGQTLWSFQLLPDEKLGEIRVGADTVFVERKSGELLALDKNTGEERYTIQPSDWRPCRIFGLDPTSRKVLIECSGSLQCLDEITGELLWQNKQLSISRDRLELFETCGSTLIMRMEWYHDTLYALDTNTGRVKWTKCYYESGELILAARDGVVISIKDSTTLQASRLQELP